MLCIIRNRFRNGNYIHCNYYYHLQMKQSGGQNPCRLKTIMSNTPHPRLSPTLVLTVSSTISELRVRALLSGIKAYISKPKLHCAHENCKCMHFSLAWITRDLNYSSLTTSWLLSQGWFCHCDLTLGRGQTYCNLSLPLSVSFQMVLTSTWIMRREETKHVSWLFDISHLDFLAVIYSTEILPYFIKQNAVHSPQCNLY